MQKRIIRLVTALLLIAVLSGTAASHAAAQTSGVEMRAQPAFEGYFKYGEWLPVWVELENSGGDIDGEVRVRVRGSAGSTVFAVPVSLPAGARKRVPVYVLPNNFSREIEVELVSGDRRIESQKVPVQSQPNISFLIGLVAPERGALALMSGIEMPGRHRPIILVDIGLQELPERVEGLKSLDVLVFNGVDTSSLTPDQAAVLKAWVAAGGRLVIGGGAGFQQTSAAFADILPVQGGQIQEISAEELAPLAEFAGTESSRDPGPFVAVLGDAGDSVVLAGSKDFPLVVERTFGAGLVDFVSLDLTAPPFEGWSGTENFWQALLSPGAAYPDSLPPDMSARQMRAQSMPYTLSNMPMLDLPSVQGLALLLGIYILLVGPVNYLVLRWRKRLHWAWVTIPLITILFSAGSFGIGYLLRGTDLVVNKVAVIEMRPGAPAGVTSYLGLFSPGADNYQVQVAGQGLLSPIQTYYDPWGGGLPSTSTSSEVVFVQGETGEVRGLSVNQWSMQSFMSEEIWPDFGQISADLQIDGDLLRGVIRNETSQVIRDAVVILGKSFVRLGDLAPGEEAEVVLDLLKISGQRFSPPLSYMLFEDQFINQGASGPPREAEVKRSVVESTFESGPWMRMSSGRMTGWGESREVMLLGWVDDAPPALSIRGREPQQQATALVYQPLEYNFPSDGTISLPPGMIPGSLVEIPRDGGICGDMSSPSVYLASGEAVFEFTVPEELRRLPVNELKLSLSTDAGWWDAPEVAVFDWSENGWGELPQVVQGLNVITDAGSLVNDSGLIRVRLSSNNTQGCYYVDMGLEAAGSPDGQES